MNKSSIDPRLLAAWTRTLRDALHWSQEALAASSGLTVRTIQRIEVGEPVNLTTRRCLARALGYEDQDIFEKPQFAKDVAAVFDAAMQCKNEEILRQHPDCIPIDVREIKTGKELAELVEGSTGFVFSSDDDLGNEVDRATAALFDYLRDYGDIYADVSLTNRLDFVNEIGDMLKGPKEGEVVIYAGIRHANMVGQNWEDKTPLRMSIVYVKVTKAGNNIGKILVPKRVQMGF